MNRPLLLTIWALAAMALAVLMLSDILVLTVPEIPVQQHGDREVADSASLEEAFSFANLFVEPLPKAPAVMVPQPIPVPEPPQAVPTSAAPEAKLPSPGFSLAGRVENSDGTVRYYIKTSQSMRLFPLQIGESLEGWLLRAARGNTLEFEKDGTVHEISK